MSRPQLTALLLALGTLLVYLPAASHGFSIFDDDDYVTQNRAVQNGLTWAGVQWAFTTGHASNWHPVTWLSHMLDCELFGLNAGAHHTVNVLFHAANTALLFVLLLRLTGAMWPAAFVAALFGWHPLHVESVAWVAERKDVLSTFFGLLTLLAYAGYARSRVEGRASRGRAEVRALAPRLWTLDYALALVCFGLGLMSKPMVVTLPFVMLLLDYWPLQRWSGVKGRESKDTAKPDTRHSSLATLILEKLPFFVLVAVSCIVTFRVQHHGGMVVSLQEMPAEYRLADVPLAYVRYLSKIIWPSDLAIFYPLPKTIFPATMLAGVALLLAVTAMVWIGRRRHPYGLVGWLWFLGTLVPVIGLVQVGHAAMADRYTYFPSVGLFIAGTFAIREWAGRFRISPMVPIAGAVLVLGACGVLTENQLRCWRDDESLFSHAIRVTRDNEPAHLCLGLVYELEGRKTEAVDQYRIALKLNPQRVKTYNSLAMLLAGSGQTNEALAEVRQALQRYPDDAPSHDTLANLLADAGRTNEALAEFERAVRLNPAEPIFQNNLGTLLVQFGRFDEAEAHYAAAARLDPTDWRAPYLAAKALLKQGRGAEAIPGFRQALQNDPDNLQVMTYLAQVLASDENPNVRDGNAAFALASRANALAGGLEPAVLDVLAMACAELGRFDAAQETAQQALNLTRAAGLTNDAVLVERRLQLYRNHQPFRQSFASHQ